MLDGPSAGLTFTFPMNPESLKESHSVNYGDHQIIGRSHPRSGYVSGGPREIILEFDLDAKNESMGFEMVGVAVFRRGVNISLDASNTLPLVRDPLEKLDACLRFIQALTYPREFTRERSIAGEVISGPPKVLFVWGDRRIRCIVRDYSVEEREWDPDLKILRAHVSMNLHEQPSRPVTFQSKHEWGDTQELLEVMGS
jgi:hypothetical protein